MSFFERRISGIHVPRAKRYSFQAIHERCCNLKRTEPYEVAGMTRGKAITQESLQAFTEGMEFPRKQNMHMLDGQQNWRKQRTLNFVNGIKV